MANMPATDVPSSASDMKATTLTAFPVPDLRFSRDRPRCNEPLDVIKFICKDLWSLVFRKQVDNLKTNHRVRMNTVQEMIAEGP